MINNVITQEFTYILVDGLLKVGPGKTKNNPINSTLGSHLCQSDLNYHQNGSGP
jgi:hypothetical protein